jgi:hypothetical protein
MGGFHLFQPIRIQGFSDSIGSHERDKPIRPLSVDDLDQWNFSFTAPTEDEIRDKATSDGLAKGLVIIQTVWFILQCCAREVERMPITELEIVTLAYALMNIVMYACWWNKPLNVTRPIRVFEKHTARQIRRHGGRRHVKAEDSGTPTVQDNWLHRVYEFILGDQDDVVELSKRREVPTFWAGKPTKVQVLQADIMTLVVGMLFGGVHCVAWNFHTFPSRRQLVLWRVSSVVITVVPAYLLLLLMLTACSTRKMWKSFGFGFIIAVLASLGFVLYIAARAVTLVLAFTSLRSLPPGAYEAVRWTTLIPHI